MDPTETRSKLEYDFRRDEQLWRDQHDTDAHTRHHMQASSQWSGPKQKKQPCKWPECYGHFCQGFECDGPPEMACAGDDETPLPWWTSYGLVAGFVAAAALVVVAAFAAGYVLQRYLPPDWLAFLFGP